jgi:transcriptional regulator with XRE-family HTH domain
VSSDLAKTFGVNMRQERERQGLSVRVLGEACDMDGSEISRLEQAERDPRLGTVERVARGLQVPPAELLRGAS